MLRGDNGILNRSAEAKFANGLAQFDEQTKLAAMSVKTSIESNKVSKAGYIATKTENVKTLANEVAKGLGVTAQEVGTSEISISSEGYTVVYYIKTPGNETTNGEAYIGIWYTDNSLRSTMGNVDITRYGLTNTNNISPNEAVLVAYIHIGNYTSEMSEKELTSLTTGITFEGELPAGLASLEVENTASEDSPGLYKIDGTFIAWNDLVGDDENNPIHISDGILTTNYIVGLGVPSKNKSAEILNGKLIIKNDVTGLGDDAFCLCTNLREIILPNSINQVGWNAFNTCSNLTSITIGNVTSMNSARQQNVFNECPKLENLTINTGEISDELFSDFTSLKNLTICDGVTSIGTAAFLGCSGLTDVIIPNSVTTMGEGVFEDCNNLDHIKVRGYANKPTSWNDDWNGKTWDNINEIYSEKHNNITWAYNGE